MRSGVRPQAVKRKDVESEKIREDVDPFVLEGSISLVGDEVDPKPIKTMRDTCCAQSMILERSLPFSEMSVTADNVLIQGIGMDVISVPLHKMNLNSDLVSGTVIVGVRPELPVKMSQCCWRMIWHVVKYYLNQSLLVSPVQKLIMLKIV